MQVAATSTNGAFTAVVATPVHANDNGWVDPEGIFKPPSTGYTVLNCNDGSGSVVKEDFTPDTVFSQSWNIPSTALPSDVKCRFMIAESEHVYWNDVILPAVANDGSSSVIGGEQKTQSDPVASDPFLDFSFPTSGNNTNSTNSTEFMFPGKETTTAILVGDGLETTTTETPMLPKGDPKNVNGVANNYWCEAYGSFYTLVPGTGCSFYHAGIYDYHTNNLKPSGKFQCIGGTKFSTILCRCEWVNNFLCPKTM